jgi:hypothetical protein
MKRHMSDEINCPSNRFLTTAGTITAIADQSSSRPINEFAIQIVEIRSMLINAMDRMFGVDHSQYSPDVLAELSALVRRVRATSPDSVLADIADAKIGRIIALCGDANI